LGFRVLALALAVAGLLGAAPATPGATLTVTLAGIRSDRGSIFCELFASPKGYPTDASKAVQRKQAAISQRAARCVFEGLGPGTYAVAAYHDENGNGKLDTNFLGIPSEGVAASNDAKGTMGPPSFDKAKLSIATADLGITIHLSY
jgi:uncharacterized protein (DUF2141 family)